MLYIIYVLIILITKVKTETYKSERLSSLMTINTYDIIMQTKQKMINDNCTSECCEQFIFYLDMVFDANWATIMFDSTSKLQSGILQGNLYELGNYDECIAIEAQTHKGHVNGKYCMAKIKLPDNLIPKHWISPELRTRVLNDYLNVTAKDLLLSIDDITPTLKFALCLPSICPALEFQRHIKNIFDNIEFDIDIAETSCHVNSNYKIKSIDVFAISLKLEKNLSYLKEKSQLFIKILVSNYFRTILVITGLIIILSTLNDLYFNRNNKKTNYPILSCFSLFTNGLHLFRINPIKENCGILGSLIGLRFLSMTWIIYAHSYVILASFPIFNFFEIETLARSFAGQLIVGSSITVDTFLVISGLLVSYTLLDKFKNGIKLRDLPLIYLHRYIRITPAYAVMILLQVTLVKYLGSGPFWKTTIQIISSSCEINWWSSLLYIQNYFNPDNICLGPSWYLSVDMQLFWIAPLLMMCIRKFNKLTYFIISALTAILVIITFYIAYDNLLLAGLITGTWKMNTIRTNIMYLPTHTRASPWFIGLGLGYLLHENRGTKVKMSSIVVAIGWSTSIITMFTVIFGMLPFMQKGYKQSPFGDKSYLALSRPAWGLTIAWIIFACENEYGGPVYWLLSLQIFQPLARLSYSIYLVHFVLQACLAGTIRTPTYFTNFQMFLTVLRDLCCSIILAIVLTLTYEFPLVNLEKIIMEKAKYYKTYSANNSIQKNCNSMHKINVIESLEKF